MVITSKYLKSAVLGASDGIITTFAVVAGVVGAGLSVRVILILGIANMVADGLSMAIGDYLGERSGFELEKNQGKSVTGAGLWKTSLLTFLAFIVAGTLPLVPYLFMLLGLTALPENQFLISAVATLTAMFVVGSLRAVVTKGKWWINGLEMLGIGSLAAVVAYTLGAFVERLV